MNTGRMNLCMVIITVVAVNANVLERLRRQPVCGDQQYLTENNGEIISHTGYNVGNDYGKNQDCIWTVEAPEGLNVLLTSITFDIESDTSCRYDYLELFDGPDIGAPSLGVFCGDELEIISSTQRFLTLHFESDSSSQLAGFKLFYNFTDEVIHHCLGSQFQCNNGKCIVTEYVCDTDDDCGDNSDELNCQTGDSHCAADQFYCKRRDKCISSSWLCDGDDDCGDGSDELSSVCLLAQNSDNCGNVNFTGTEGSITSPGWPQNYTSNTRCLYFIQAPVETQEIIFTFDDFSLESQIECEFDSVNIIGDLDNAENRYGPFCGEGSPDDVTITGDHAYILFQTDDTIDYGGFAVNWLAH